jgi:hypothetical protein
VLPTRFDDTPLPGLLSDTAALLNAVGGVGVLERLADEKHCSLQGAGAR